MEEQNVPEFNEDEAVAFIYKQLIAGGYAVTEEAIREVLKAEFDYMVSVGLAIPMD